MLPLLTQVVVKFGLLKRGVVLRVWRLSLPAKSAELLSTTADDEGIAYRIEVTRGQTNTDADAYHLSRAGIPTGLVSIPTRYIHTPTELVSLDDVENAVRLLVAFAGRLGSASLEV